MIRAAVVALLKLVGLLLVLALLFGALPEQLFWLALRGLWAALTWPLVALSAPLGSLVLACVLGTLGAAWAHDAVLHEDYVAAQEKAREVYQRRKWLPW